MPKHKNHETFIANKEEINFKNLYLQLVKFTFKNNTI
jgi:hypothetical protein